MYGRKEGRKGVEGNNEDQEKPNHLKTLAKIVQDGSKHDAHLKHGGYVMPETNRGVDPNHVIDSLGRQVAQHAVEVAKRDAEIARLREQVAELEDDKPTDT